MPGKFSQRAAKFGTYVIAAGDIWVDICEDLGIFCCIVGFSKERHPIRQQLNFSIIEYIIVWRMQ